MGEARVEASGWNMTSSPGLSILHHVRRMACSSLEHQDGQSMVLCAMRVSENLSWFTAHNGQSKAAKTCPEGL